MDTNNESFKLLGLSDSDSDSDVSEFVLTPPRKKKRKRRFRASSGPSPQVHSSNVCQFKSKAIALTLIIALLCWLSVITWLAVTLHGEINRLETDVQGVVAGSQGVPDALQKCHSMSRELQQNQTALFNRLAVLSLQTGNFTSQLVSMQNGLQNLEERLKATPELINVPQDLKELRANVAMFGSQIRDLEATVTNLKDQYNQLQDTSKSLLQNVSTVQASFTQLLDASQHPQVVAQENKEEKTVLLNQVAQIALNITKVNDTLISKLNWLVDDQRNDHKLIEAIQNVGQNVSARVTTLEGDCARLSVVSALNTTVKLLDAKVNNGSVQISDLDKKISILQSQHDKLDQQLPLASAMRQSNINLVPVSESIPGVYVSSHPVTPTSQQVASSVVPRTQTEKP